MPDNYYIADLHISHKHVIDYDQRPFLNVEQMNDALISNWNKVVKKNDTVYVLGDFIWSKEQKWPEIIEQLKGNIVLIKGNHDPKSFSKKTKDYFADIKDYKEIEDNGTRVIMCHYPIPFFNHDFESNTVMLYGHVHKSIENDYLEKLRQFVIANKNDKGPSGNFINVGCMMPYMEYRPKTLSEIMRCFNE